MSTWKPPKYGVKAREQGWINNIIQTHDLWCGCNDPITHLVTTAIKKGGIFGFNKESAIQLLQCHSTQQDGDGDKDGEKEDCGPEGNLDFGDLDRLFEEDTDFEEESTG